MSDFGLAKWLDASSDLTRTLTIFGTPGYIAPEQARGVAAEVKPAADVYSLGAILFDLLAGRPPFLGEHALAVIKQAEERPAPKLRSLVKNADRDLETICAKCLEREPCVRYRSAPDLAEDLQRWLEGRPIIARPVSVPTRSWRWVRRNPYLAAGIVLSSALAIGAAGIQAHSHRLAESVTAQAAARHSIVVEPILDLDNASTNQEVAKKLARSLASEFPRYGPAAVSLLENGRPTPVTKSSRFPNPTYARAKLCSTVREKDGKVRLATRLLDSATDAVVMRKIVELDRHFNVANLGAQELAQTIYRALDSDQLLELPTRDPGMLNPRSRELIVTARDLMDRQTVIDLDRAEVCLRRALELEPKSSVTNAYLASLNNFRVAYTSNRTFLPVAAEAARRAIAIESENDEAQRAAAATALMSARYDEALEHCYREVESSGPGKRQCEHGDERVSRVGPPRQGACVAGASPQL